MTFEFISWADFRCVLHQFSSLTRSKGSWGQVWPESGRNRPKLQSILKFPIKTTRKISFWPPGGQSAGLSTRTTTMWSSPCGHADKATDTLSGSLAIGSRRSGASRRSAKIGILSGSLAIRYSDFSCFRPIFGQTWPQNPSRTTGLVLQCRLHQKSAPQTNSKAISWKFGILKSPPRMNR